MSITKKLLGLLLLVFFANKIVAQDFVLDQITVSANRVFTPVN